MSGHVIWKDAQLNTAITPLKVLILSFEYPPRAGAGTHVFELATGLNEAGCSVAVLAPTAGAPVKTHDDSITEHLVQPSAETCAIAARGSRVQGVLAVNEDLIARGQSLIFDHRQRPDVIHCHDWYTFPAAQELRRRFGIPVVGTAHSTSDPIVIWWGETPDNEVVRQEKALYRTADALITVSHSLRDIIQAVHEVPCKRIHVIHNGLNVERFMRPRLDPQQINKLRSTIAAPDEKIVIFAGRLTSQKGISALLASASQVLAANLRVRYLILGEADSLDSSRMIKEWAERYAGAHNHIKLLGRVSRKQLAILYHLADLALVPSLYEPFGYAAIEAMAAGVPVIATGVGGLAEIIEDGKTGLLVKVHADANGPHRVDVEGLTTAQLDLLSNNVKAKELGRAGQQHVSSHFGLQRMINSTIQVYRQVINFGVNASSGTVVTHKDEELGN
jgi:glycosyltransferase involved in cell wall biosynthesis